MGLNKCRYHVEVDLKSFEAFVFNYASSSLKGSPIYTQLPTVYTQFRADAGRGVRFKALGPGFEGLVDVSGLGLRCGGSGCRTFSLEGVS